MAWTKLGYKKYGSRWLTDEQITEAEAQKRAEKVWLPQLKKIHKDIHGSNGARKRDLAQEPRSTRSGMRRPSRRSTGSSAPARPIRP